jgi:hypothetical protein
MLCRVFLPRSRVGVNFILTHPHMAYYFCLVTDMDSVLRVGPHSDLTVRITADTETIPGARAITTAPELKKRRTVFTLHIPHGFAYHTQSTLIL